MVEEFDGEDESGSESNKPLDFQGFEGERERLGTIETERGGFEPPERFYPLAALAKRCFRPLSHLSKSRTRHANHSANSLV